MTTVIIGQRGVGKTQFLKRLHRYLGNSGPHCFDLDLEVEKKTKKTVRQIFETDGEPAFRDFEKQVFNELLISEKGAFIAVGAGFPVGLIPENAKVLWLQRATDPQGRIFLDRPRLEKDLSPLQEYEKRGRLRDLHFKNVYDQIYLMPEGLTELDSLEEDLLIVRKKILSGIVTLTPDLFLKKGRWHGFIENYAQRGVEFFELRNDLLDHDQVQTCLGSMFSEKFIYSFRTDQFENYPQGSQIHYYDWALELGPMPQPIRFLKQRLIISLHQLNEGEILEDAMNRLHEESGKAVHLKLSPLIHNFEDLLLGYLWQQADPQNRSFLPRSPQGRWGWFRLWMKGRQLLNYWRETISGSTPDQPTVYEWQSVHFIKTTFAAILGSPVVHSWTPVEQHNFFEERNEPVFRIQIDTLEWNRALNVLNILGLRHAAVTSPLKEEAFHSCGEKSELIEILRSVNSMTYDSEKKIWVGENTDMEGFKALIEDVKPGQKIAIWGGGGTLIMLKKALPQAISFSASRGKVREEDQARWNAHFMPDIVIWAAPRHPEMAWPQEDWKPSLVIDLNYTENSAGREYALRLQTTYRSGLKMFQVQAQHQRDFWEGKK
jgi:shikimate 5-dehydrogenase/shikimate kinase